MEITLSLGQIIEIGGLLVYVVGSYWYVKNRLNLLEVQKASKEDLNWLAGKVNEKLSKDDFTTAMNGIRKEVSKGVDEVTEVYHELDKKVNEAMFKIRNLEDKHGV